MEWDGERELTADEAAEYFKSVFGEGVYPDNIAGYYYSHEVVLNAYIKYYHGEFETFTAALNAAARAVYRRQG